MGGQVSVMIKKDNKITKLEKSTGSYETLLYGYDALNNNFDAEIEKYKENAKEGMCALVDYGLVFFDFDKKEVHTLQSYDYAGTLFTINISNSYSRYVIYHTSNPLKEYILQDKVDILIDNKRFNLNEVFGETKEEILENLINPEKIMAKKGIDLFWTHLIRKEWISHYYEKKPEDVIALLNVVFPYIKTKEEIDRWKDSLFYSYEYNEKELSIKEEQEQEIKMQYALGSLEEKRKKI